MVFANYLHCVALICSLVLGLRTTFRKIFWREYDIYMNEWEWDLFHKTILYLYFHIAVPLEGKLLVKLLQTRLASFPLAPVREASDCSYLTELHKTGYIWPRLFSLLSDKVQKKVWSICSNVLWFKHCMVILTIFCW